MSERINYSQVWEDPRVVFEALKPEAGKTYLVISSGGDNVLALLLSGARVHAVDVNPAQNHLLMLKFVAAQRLHYEEYLEFLGVRVSSRRLALYTSLRHDLPADVTAWWDGQQTLIRRGLIHGGRFERFTAGFARYVLPRFVSHGALSELLSSTDVNDQSRIYASCFDGVLWRSVYSLATSRFVLAVCARPRMMFTGSRAGAASPIYRARLERLIRTIPLNDNFFFHYSALGHYRETLPPYLTEEGHATLKNVQAQDLYIRTASVLDQLQSAPENTYTGYDLSDIGDALADKDFDALWPEIVRTAHHEASVVYWTNLVPRVVPASLNDRIRTDDALVSGLRALDRVFFYEAVQVHSIHKI